MKGFQKIVTDRRTVILKLQLVRTYHKVAVEVEMRSAVNMNRFSATIPQPSQGIRDIMRNLFSWFRHMKNCPRQNMVSDPIFNLSWLKLSWLQTKSSLRIRLTDPRIQSPIRVHIYNPDNLVHDELKIDRILMRSIFHAAKLRITLLRYDSDSSLAGSQAAQVHASTLLLPQMPSSLTGSVVNPGQNWLKPTSYFPYFPPILNAYIVIRNIYL